MVHGVLFYDTLDGSLVIFFLETNRFPEVVTEYVDGRNEALVENYSTHDGGSRCAVLDGIVLACRFVEDAVRSVGHSVNRFFAGA